MVCCIGQVCRRWHPHTATSAKFPYSVSSIFLFFFNFNFISYPFPKFRVSNVDNNSFTGIRRSRQDVLELPLFKRDHRHALPTTKHQQLLLLLTTTGNSQRSRPTARTHSRCPTLARAPQNAHFSTLKFFSTLYYTEEPQLDTIQI